MMVLVPEEMGFLESIVFSIGFKEMLEDPRVGSAEIYGFARSACLIAAFAICFWCYRRNLKYMRFFVGLMLVATVAKWGVEYLAYAYFFKGADYSVKYYVMIIFGFVLLALFGAALEDEKDGEEETA